MARDTHDKVDPAKTSELLGKGGFFGHLQEDLLKRISSRFFTRSVPSGEEILEQGDPSTEFYLIASGRVKVVRKGVDGREVVLATLQDGDFFGELSIFTGETRSASAVAAVRTELLGMRREDFMQLLKSSPELGITILGELSRRLIEANRTIASLLWDNAYGKVVLTIKRLAQKEGVPRGDALVIKHRVTHQEIADMAGTSRETASRIMIGLKKAGAVVTSGKNMIIRESNMPGTLDP